MRRVGVAMARELVYTGKMIDAASEKMAKNLIATASAIKAAEAARQG